MEKKKYLLVVAHPDDEALAAGATIHKLSNLGHEVYMCLLNSVSDIRCMDSIRMIREMELSHKILGVQETMIGNFMTLHFNTIPQIELVKFIESAISKYQPDVVITHHECDLHSDHQQVSLACKAAVRLSQRQTKVVNHIKEFYYMEVPSSTDWGVATGSRPFIPNTYINISDDDFKAKVESLKVYSEGAVLREMPHPRSEEALKALAVKRGTEIGYMMAESLEMVFRGIEL